MRRYCRDARVALAQFAASSLPCLEANTHRTRIVGRNCSQLGTSDRTSTGGIRSHHKSCAKGPLDTAETREILMFVVVGGLAFTATHGLRAAARPCVSRLHASTASASPKRTSYGRPRRHGVLAGAQQEIDGKSSDSAPSVSGTVYSAGDDAPTVQLFTKAGCTLCDVAKGVLASASAEQPHTLEAVDITDEDKVRLTLTAAHGPGPAPSPLHDPDPDP